MGYAYDTEVQVRKLPSKLLLTKYRDSSRFLDSCKLCPDYGKVWSCPPGLPDAGCYLEDYDQVFLIAVKVLYLEETREQAVSQEATARIRQETYEQVKKRLLLTLLTMEQEVPSGKCLGAGRCILCERCTRADGKPCRFPDQRRYSITGFGFDFTKLLPELLGIPLLWSPKGLPEYDVAVAALFYKEEK